MPDELVHTQPFESPVIRKPYYEPDYLVRLTIGKMLVWM